MAWTIWAAALPGSPSSISLSAGVPLPVCKMRAPLFATGLRLFRIPDFFSGRLIISTLYNDTRESGRGHDGYKGEEEMSTFVSSSLFSERCLHLRVVSSPLSTILAFVMDSAF